MKINLCILIFPLLLTGCNNGASNTSSMDNSFINYVSKEVDGEKVAQIIVMAGQSNMEGHSWNSKLYDKTPSVMHGYYKKGFENTKIMFHCNNGSNQSLEFVPVKVGQGYGTGSFGPEVGIAQKLQNINYKKEVFLVKYALGATGLYDRWNVNNNNSLYYEMVNYVDEQIITLEELGFRVEIKALLWMQGEDDSNSVTGTNDYYENLSNMVENFRDNYEELYGVKNRGIAFVDAGISDCSAWKNYVEINNAKKEYSLSNPEKNYYFSTIDNGLEYRYDNTDIYHFDATSELKLGELFINELLNKGWL